MSAAAVEKLQQIWKKLEFAFVKRVIAREPEDVLGITFYDYKEIDQDYWARLETGNFALRRSAEIPAEDRWRTEVQWRHYYGFTSNGIYFQKDGCCRLDVDILLTLDFGLYGNHCDIGWQKPEPGVWIAGEVIMTPKGKKFNQWFVCSPEFLALYTAVMNGKAPTKLSVFAQKLVTDDTTSYDAYITLAALVLFDDIETFVNMLDNEQPEITHPCHGQPFGKRFLVTPDKAIRNKVGWNHIRIPNTTVSNYVHSMAHLLDPNWWTTFTEMAKKRNSNYSHSDPYYCAGCEAGFSI